METLHEVLSSIWTVWAVLLFTSVIGWAVRPANRARFERDANIPLNDEM